jgi:ferredoxin
MIGALQKREYGIVTWDADRCIGCRYCGVACAYEVPRFEWDERKPKIIKCELCDHRIAEGKEPACCEVCPRQAVIYGTRKELLEEAHRRIEAQPGRYVQKVFGEFDGGGTQVLYVSHLDFDKLGLPDLGEEAPPRLTRDVQHGVYQGFITPAVLYAALGVVAFRNRRASREEEVDHD